MGLGPASQQQRKVEEVYMKERILKMGVPLLLVAVLVAAGVYPITSSQAAAKGTTYNVVCQKGTASVTYISIAGGAASPNIGDMVGITFKMVVDAKAKTEKVKSTGQKATYYPVTILAKSFSAPKSRMPMPGGKDYANTTMLMKKDAKGKLYSTAGSDVDVSSVMGKKLASKIGDGTADPAGSLIIDLTVFTTSTLESSGKVFLQLPLTCAITTGKSYIVVKGTKTRLEGKALPNDDNGKTVPTPLVGQPVDLDAGTGTLVGTTATLNIKNKTMGLMDFLHAAIFVVKITK